MMDLRITMLLSSLLASAIAAPLASGEQLESFTEPYRQVGIPAAEIGIISKILVKEGDRVSEKQILAQLDDTVLTTSLAVARAAMEALGGRRSAEAELKMRTEQLSSYHSLFEQGNATSRELQRAENEHLQAQARLQSVREEIEIRRLEYQRVKAQLKQRRMESPIAGVVVEIVKEVGEFVSPTDPVVMTVVQLDTLKSRFSVPVQAARDLKAGQVVNLSVGYEEVPCQGEIEFVSPIAEPESGTVRVKIRIPNLDGRLQSGSVCRWSVAYDSEQRVTRQQGPARR